MTDVFEILLQCSEEPNSWCWLLVEAVKQQAPVLSVLASCLQVRIMRSLSKDPDSNRKSGEGQGMLIIREDLGEGRAGDDSKTLAYVSKVAATSYAFPA